MDVIKFSVEEDPLFPSSYSTPSPTYQTRGELDKVEKLIK